jgi:hypothetical protein
VAEDLCGKALGDQRAQHFARVQGAQSPAVGDEYPLSDLEAQ